MAMNTTEWTLTAAPNLPRSGLKFVLDISMQYNGSSSSFAHHMGSTSSEQLVPINMFNTVYAEPKIEHLSQPENTNSRHNTMDSLVLLCCKGALCVYPLKSVVQANMERTMSSTENGQIAMTNGSEVAFISLVNDGD
ncbi:hypothetical protein Tco_0400383 [Tanacetum coccineum]